MNFFGEFERVDCRKKWIEVLRMGKQITPSMRVCSRHFKTDDYMLRGTF